MEQNIFKVMVNLQHKLNIQTAGENYLEKNLNWNSAIIAESGELLDSLGYKWWKKQEPDMENVKVEAIDLLHFVISDTLQMNYDIRNFSDILNSTIRDFEVGFKEISINLKNSKLLKLIDLLNTDRLSRFIVMKAIFEKLEMSNEDVYIAYITKNCLNKFRQNNGYKDGTYIKTWWDNREDNVVAFDLASIIGPKETLFDELYESLTAYYIKYVLKDKKEAHTSSILDGMPDPFKCYKKI